MESKTMVWVVFALFVSVGAGSTVWGDNSSDIENITISVDGVEPTAENIRDGSYALHRDLILVTNKGGLSDTASDFINWILSTEGQSIVADSGFVPMKEPIKRVKYEVSKSITVVGSTTMLPLMSKLVEVYEKSTDVTVRVMGGGSGKGIGDVKRAEERGDDSYIGMVSKDLSPEEASSFNVTKIASDGVVMLIDKLAGVTDLSLNQIAKIFNGEITNWIEVGGNDLRISPIVGRSEDGTRSTLDNAMSKELGISIDEMGSQLNHYPLASSSRAMLFNVGFSNGAIGYVNMNIVKNL